jgi:hypothetical protein
MNAEWSTEVERPFTLTCTDVQFPAEGLPLPVAPGDQVGGKKSG